MRTRLAHLLCLMTLPSLLAGVACNESTAPASDLAGTWDYVDSTHAVLIEYGLSPARPILFIYEK